MTGRNALTLAGVLLFVLGAIELFQPGLVPLPSSEILLSLFGGIALLYALLVYRSRRQNGPEQADTPDVEASTPARVPGTDLEATLDGFPGPESVYGGTSPTLRRGLQTAAAAVVTRYEGVSPEEATEQVENGTWTDDPYAADFISETNESPSRLRDRVQKLIAPRTYRSRYLTRTVDAIASEAGVETEPEESADTELGPSAEEVETRVDGSRSSSEVDGLVNQNQTHHWTGISILVLVCLGVGLIFELPGVLLAGIVGIGYAAYARATPQQKVELSASRSLSETAPDPGEEFEVTVTITNEGGFCPDIRIVDGVPESLAVTDGSPRYGTALRAGESVRFSYTVEAKQGTHEFGPVLVLARNLSSSVEQKHLLTATTTVESIPSPQPVTEKIPLRRQPTRYAGRMTTDSGGEGLEFHTVREYQPGDSMSRIDWNRRARTGELTTLEFRRERAARIVILIDVRPAAYAGHDPGAENAVERSVAAAQRLFPRLLDDGHQVGIGVFGPQECYLAPDNNTSHRQRGRELLATHPVFHSRTEAGSAQRYWEANLREKLPGNTQLLVFSPLLDSQSVRLIRQFEAYGYLTTVVSPDATANETPSRRLNRASRQLFMTDLRQAGIPVLDWTPDDSLDTILTREVTLR